MEEIDELEQMRGQLSLLKNKLDKEQIVNDRLMQEAVKTKVSSINRIVWVKYIVAIIEIPLCTWVFYWLRTSLPFIIVSDLFFIAAIVYTYIAHSGVNSCNVTTDNFLELSKKILRLKRMTARWFKFGLSFLGVWGVWFLLEVYIRMDFRIIAYSFFAGLVTGLVIGLSQYRKQQRMISELIKQIEDYSN
jgi:hypothetical protein